MLANRWIRRRRAAVLPGSAGAYFSTPDSAGASVTGDIDLRVNVALDDWTPAVAQVMVAKYGAAGTQLSYQFFVNATTGRPEIQVSANGSSGIVATATAAPGYSDGMAHWLRVTRVAATGAVTFYTSDDGATWAQLGDVVSATSGNIFDSTSNVRIGTNGDASVFLTGKVFRAQIYAGSTLNVDFNPNEWGSGTTWVSATAETWTLNGATLIGY